jgi:hypothetical protein
MENKRYNYLKQGTVMSDRDLEEEDDSSTFFFLFVK